MSNNEFPHIDITKILEGDYKKLEEYGESVGKYLARNNVKRSQLRKIFSHVRKILTKAEIEEWEKIEKDVLLIKPKMAYTAGRHKELKPFYDKVVSKIINEIDSKEKFSIFYDFIESILAYHRYYGGKE